jgi:hypothetical protein
MEFRPVHGAHRTASQFALNLKRANTLTHQHGLSPHRL